MKIFSRREKDSCEHEWYWEKNNATEYTRYCLECSKRELFVYTGNYSHLININDAHTKLVPDDMLRTLERRWKKNIKKISESRIERFNKVKAAWREAE